jgi:hypothetical protein
VSLMEMVLLVIIALIVSRVEVRPVKRAFGKIAWKCDCMY